MSRQPIPEKEIKLLFLKSGNLCAFPTCNQSLLIEATQNDSEAIVGEMAHIIADSRQGPRGRAPLADEDRNKSPNLILLCRNHHKLIDSQPNTYSIPVLLQMKADHENRVRELLQPTLAKSGELLKTEVLQSTILPVSHLPEVVFAAPCPFNESQKNKVKQSLNYKAASSALLPFVLHENRLLSFMDLRTTNTPFSPVIEGEAKDVQLLKASELWQRTDGLRLYQMLLNRALYKFAGRRHIRYDPAHHRFYFSANPNREERRVKYRSLTNRRISRKVAWCPIKKSTGEARNFWWHWAAALRFHIVGDKQWCLSIRPERHLTKDGETPFPAEQIGRRVTSIKARMYNAAYLKEVHFWRDYLSDGQERFIFDFGTQSAVVGASFIPVTVTWPGVLNDNIDLPKRETQEDLFSFAELNTATSGEEFDWEEENETEDELLIEEDDTPEVPA